MNSYLKFIWDWKSVIIPLLLYCFVIYDVAHVELLFQNKINNGYNGFSYSVEINGSKIWQLITTNLTNLIKGF